MSLTIKLQLLNASGSCASLAGYAVTLSPAVNG
ncbi:hypothetical protein IWX79_003945 [Janthinobacterium sp. CAN_S1]